MYLSGYYLLQVLVGSPYMCSAQFANLRTFEYALHKLEIANQFRNGNPIWKSRSTFAHS